MTRWQHLMKMGNSYLEQERFSEAELLLSEALSLARKDEVSDKEFLLLLKKLTQALRTSDPQRARDLDEELLKVVREGEACTKTDEEEVMLWILGSRREFEADMAPPERQRLLRMAISVVHMAREEHGDISIETAHAIYEVASILVSLKKVDLAVRALRQALRQAVMADGKHPVRLKLQMKLAQALLLDGGIEESRTLLFDVLERRDKEPSLYNRKEKVRNLYLLAQTEAILGRDEVAKEFALKAMAIEEARAPTSELLREIQLFVGDENSDLTVQ
ncbi:MAG: hypothetical protein GY822_25170 [Deltaproteobacteria bacterium]|nr:hypothetical protein [Deltaproteobacteria bacterium]